MTTWDFLDDDEAPEGTALLSARRSAVATAAELPFLLLLSGAGAGRLVVMSGPDLIVGRSEEASLTLLDEGISRRHARFFHRGGIVWVEDLGSTNGTVVNGRRLDDPVPLRDGDKITIGACTMVKLSLDQAGADDFEVGVYRSATRDPETGVFRRYALLDRIDEEIAYARRHRTSVSVLAIEAASAPAIEAKLGRQGSVFAVRALAVRTGALLRAEDVLARLGRHRLAILCRSTTRPEALELAQRLVEGLGRERIDFEGQPLDLTPALGVAALPSSEQMSSVRLLALAEEELEARLGRSAG